MMPLKQWRNPLTFDFVFFTDPATTEIYTLSLRDALPISAALPQAARRPPRAPDDSARARRRGTPQADRKSTRLNSSHSQISYAVFCLKKKQRPAIPLSARVSDGGVGAEDAERAGAVPPPP